MTIKKFFIFSIAVHVIILLGVCYIPLVQEKKEKEIFAVLISHSELPKIDIKPPRKQKRSVTSPRHIPKKTATPQAVPIKPRPEPSAEEPVVPDYGEGTKKPLPEDLYPETDNTEKKGIDSKKRKFISPGFSDQEKIFDKGIIGDLVRKDFDEEVKSKKEITFDTKEYRYVGYMTKLKEKIESIWIYPPEAKVRGIYGDLKISFTIKKNGRLGAVELVRTSGYKMLDDAAIKALKDGEPYWPLPDDWGMESYTINGHFIYSIYGYYVR